MPELPEVETTRRGIARHVEGKCVLRVVVRNSQLRWPVPRRLAAELAGRRIQRVWRRAKYLLFEVESGTLLLHLGMSGALRLVPQDTPVGRHDHVDIVLDTGHTLRLTDPRRFGSIHWTPADPLQHRLLKDLGPEPLSKEFSGATLHRALACRSSAVKTVIMDSHIVVGVGNIYASESLWHAGIHPTRAANRIALRRCVALADAIKLVLAKSIKAGGTTLRDFVGSDGKPGYFRQQLQVYGRADQPCRRCRSSIRHVVTGQRSTFYCPSCQR